MLSLSLPKTCLNAVAFSPDGARLATGGTGGRVRVWTLNPPAVERTFVVPCNDMARDLLFTADGSLLIRADQKLHAFDREGGTLHVPDYLRSDVMRIACAGTRQALAILHSKAVTMYEPRLWTPTSRFDIDLSVPPLAASLSCTPDGHTVAVAHRVAVHVCREGSEIPAWLHRGSVEVKAVALSPAGDALAICAHTHLRLWRLTPEPKELAHVQLGKTHFRAVAWHPGGAFFATANGDGTVDYWDARTGARRESFDWKIGKMHDVTFDAAGDRAACCSLTGKVVVWDVDR
jgi:WD40 repeat protein